MKKLELKKELGNNPIEIAYIKSLELKDFGVIFFIASILITLLCSLISSLFGKELLKRCIVK